MFVEDFICRSLKHVRRTYFMQDTLQLHFNYLIYKLNNQTNSFPLKNDELSKNRCNFQLPSKHVLAAFDFTSENDFSDLQRTSSIFECLFCQCSISLRKNAFITRRVLKCAAAEHRTCTPICHIFNHDFPHSEKNPIYANSTNI